MPLGIASLALVSAPIQAADPPPLDAYGELPAFEEAEFSPSGNLAILGKVEGERMILVLDAAFAPRKAIKIGEMKVRDIEWAGDDNLLVERTDTVDLDARRFLADKIELANIMIVPMDDNTPAATIFAGDRNLVKGVFGGYGIRQVKGKWLAYVGGLQMNDVDEGRYEYQGGSPALYAVDLASNNSKKVGSAPIGGIHRDYLIADDGTIAATLDWKEGAGEWYIVNQKGTKIASGIEPDGGISLLALGRDGTSAIYSEDDDNDVPHWFEVPLDGSKPAAEILVEIKADRPLLEPGSARMVGYWPDETTNEVVFFDAARQAAVTEIEKAFAGRHPRLHYWTPDFQRVLLSTSGNGDSGTWYVLDVATKQSRRIGAERPAVGGGMVGPVSTVAYKAGDGTQLDGILTLPPGRQAKNLPVILLPHGGPHASDSEGFDWWAQAFASRGYAVFQPNFRGSTNRDEAFRQASYGQWGRKMQTDVSDGLAELVRQGVADPKRACIMGASYGGYAALAGVTLQNGIYRCAVAVAGVSDVKMMYDTDLYESGRDRFIVKNLKEELGDPSSFGDISPRQAAASADAPIMLIHGRDDTVVPFRHSRVMADALKDAGKPFEMIELRDEDHWLSRPATRKQMLEAAMAFVLKHNPPD